MATITIHAPSTNFVEDDDHGHERRDSRADSVDARLRRQCLPRSRNQCLTIPVCASVKAVKTPITYRWISEFTFARKPTISSAENRRQDHDPVREDEPVAEVA